MDLLYSSIIYISAGIDSQLGDPLRPIILITELLCCVTLCFGVMAENTPVKIGLNEVQSGLAGVNAPTANSPVKAAAAPAQVPPGKVIVLEQDSGTNLTKMNVTFTISPTYGSAQAVRFTPPKSGWNLENGNEPSLTNSLAG